MAKAEKRKRIIRKADEGTLLKPLNDGTNTPVPGENAAHALSESEAALFKQAENPLGDPQKK